jgi:hypothetical protein
MPTVYEVYGFKIYFWSNENNEPVHFHVSKGSMTSNSTKFLILSNGYIEMEHNKGRYKKSELVRLVNAVYGLGIQYKVIELWKVRFGGIYFKK